MSGSQANEMIIFATVIAVAVVIVSFSSAGLKWIVLYYRKANGLNTRHAPFIHTSGWFPTKKNFYINSSVLDFLPLPPPLPIPASFFFLPPSSTETSNYHSQHHTSLNFWNNYIYSMFVSGYVFPFNNLLLLVLVLVFTLFSISINDPLSYVCFLCTTEKKAPSTYSDWLIRTGNFFFSKQPACQLNYTCQNVFTLFQAIFSCLPKSNKKNPSTKYIIVLICCLR